MGINHQPNGSPSHDADEALFDLLTGPAPPTRKTILQRRDAALDPLLIAAAAASGPHVTRNHYHHDFFPGVMLPQAEGALDWTKFAGEDATAKQERRRLIYVSRQAPRRQRIQQGLVDEDGKENGHPREADPLKTADNLPLPPKKRRPSLVNTSNDPELTRKPVTNASLTSKKSVPLEVKCMARTRIPTPHGPVFLHLYHNNRDDKEHLAIVVDPAQFGDNPSPVAPFIRSQSLDAIWNDSETELERITRGAYVGRLSPDSQHPSSPSHRSTAVAQPVPPPLIRIHSECFTGETIGSMRCDCGEQLDEAIRLISQPVTLATSKPTTIPGRGAVVYLRQEGRGIGLLSKIRAYNLQDLGHDTVTANLMLGHKADERGYEIAAAILRDLRLGSEGVRVLTNNPDKIKALEREGISIVDRMPMIPRSWKARNPLLVDTPTMPLATSLAPVLDDGGKIPGATLVGGNAVHGGDLDKYLRTKVLRMGHILPLWLEDPEQ